MREHLAFSSDSWPFNASCRNTGCTERNLWCWWWWWCGIGKHNTRVHLHVHTNNAAGIILTGMQVVEHREREGLERRWKRWRRRRRRRTRYGRAPLPRTKPDKYTIIYTLSETCISYLVSQSTISHRRKWMSYKLLPITQRS